MNAITVSNLQKNYPAGKEPGFSFGPVSLSLPEGAILGLIGENGAGKTTLMKLILGLRRFNAGEISVLGGQPEDASVKEQLGVVLDEPGVPACLTPRQFGKVLRRIYRSWDDACYERYLRELELPENKAFSDFSKGMKMKLSIAAALAHHPKLLILDEPTSGLDPVVREEVVELFSDFTRDPSHSVLISSHIVGDLEKLCDYTAFLHHGKLLLCEEKDRLLEQYGILHCSLEDCNALPPEAILHRKDSPYGVEALVRRDLVPAGLTLSSAGLEEIFVGMVKEAR